MSGANHPTPEEPTQVLTENCPKCGQQMFNHPRSITRCAKCGHEWAMKEPQIPFTSKNQSPGSWMDEWGACKVCGGEIPQGHTTDCDVFKMEMELRAFRECEKFAASLSCPKHGLVPNLASFDNKCPECKVERLTRERDEAQKLRDINADAVDALRADGERLTRERDMRRADAQLTADRYEADQRQIADMVRRRDDLINESMRLRAGLERIASREAEAREAVDKGFHNTTFAIDLAGMAREVLNGANHAFETFDVREANRKLCAAEGHVLSGPVRPCLRCHEWFDPHYGSPLKAPAPDPYTPACEGGSGGPCCSDDCEKCWPDEPSEKAPETFERCHFRAFRRFACELPKDHAGDHTCRLPEGPPPQPAAAQATVDEQVFHDMLIYGLGFTMHAPAGRRRVPPDAVTIDLDKLHSSEKAAAEPVREYEHTCCKCGKKFTSPHPPGGVSFCSYGCT